jgi:hypothetical protein
MDVKTLIELHPRFYHMAEGGTWPNIKANGLLSTAAVLDRFGISGKAREVFEDEHRPTKMAVGPANGGIVLRDQKPMAPDRLVKALSDGTSPREWYRRLNGMVFMWARQERLYGLLGARSYRALEHDVLTIDSQRLLKSYASRAWLCHMNSGNTFPYPQPRGKDLFKRIPNYPSKKNGKPAKDIVEVVVDYSVPDIRNFVVNVQRMRGDEVVADIAL